MPADFRPGAAISTAAMDQPGWREAAPAKINLALHVTGQRADGYHTLSSLVAFAEHGDSLTAVPSQADGFALSGPFAGALGDAAGDDNIVCKARHLARAVVAEAGHDLVPLALSLEKSLPVASGIGGGSADAAALLRIVAGMFPACTTALRRASLELGADVPMCFDGFPAAVEGLGEIARPLARFPAVPCLLVNPGIAVSTPAVFRQLASRSNPPMAPIPPAGFASLAELTRFLAESRNDLAAAAATLVPAISDLECSLRDAGADFARMSGSGATVFALFDTVEACDRAARAIALRHPAYWILETRLMTAKAKEAP